jgi:hypothetical protein
MADDDFEECDFSGLAKIYCAHCLGHKLGDEKPDPPKFGNLDPEDEDDTDSEDLYEVIGRAFETKYKGHCTLNYDHKIKMGSRVARVQRRDNPMIPVPGVACSDCIRMLPKARL